jgi:hypothetical protein
VHDILISNAMIAEVQIKSVQLKRDN